MFRYPLGLLIASGMMICGAASAQAPMAAATAAADISEGSMVRSADGKRLGRIERIVTDKAGAPLSAGLIMDSRFVYLPYGTLSAAGTGVTTSLSKTEVRNLK